jgi:hypothetical protein
MLKALQQEIQLGTMKKGDTKNFHFTVKNMAQERIKINAITVGCGPCTKASTSTTDLQPQGTSVIDVSFTPNSTGMQSKNVSIDYSEGGAHMPALVLKFRASVNE